ncbi:unnamed protein product [Blepharisma stoltei]|uniref:HMG box domain-containing protein n=1 Tax=Blepharisma stoltei TaxID=1481888 RepID=A0AAU9J677_9CILI|nr:unnamed protein product [Blepharisma stoltei]
MSTRKPQNKKEPKEEPKEDTESEEEEEESTADRWFKGDPNLQMPPPKRNKSAYLFYTLERRPEIMEKYPGISGRDILIKLGKMWRKTSYDEREPYQKMYEMDKERFERQIKEYEETGKYYDDEGNIDRSQFFSRSPTSQSVQAKAKRKVSFEEAQAKKSEKISKPMHKEHYRDQDVQLPPPRRNLSAYTFWTLDKRPEIMEKHPGISGRDILIELGELWHKTSEKEKEPYYQKYEDDRKRYERQSLEYEKRGKYFDEEGNLDRSRMFARRKISSRSVGAMAKRKAQIGY